MDFISVDACIKNKFQVCRQTSSNERYMINGVLN